MSRRFFTADLHLGHTFVARQRGFDTADQHDAWLAENWKATVSKADVVYVLGDVVMRHLDDNLDLLASLPGAKHLISGNHDACHPMHRRALAQHRRYLKAFETISSAGSVRIGSHTILLSHFPYTGDHADREDRCQQWRLRDEGGLLLHGHVHDAWQQRLRQFNVGIDHFPAPVPESAVRTWADREVSS